MSSIGKLMKQAARMQQQMEQVQSQLAARTVEATSGGGAVKVVAKCDGTLASIKIDRQALNPADAQLLEDMVITAANQALTQAKEISNTEMGKVTAGFNVPGLTRQNRQERTRQPAWSPAFRRRGKRRNGDLENLRDARASDGSSHARLTPYCCLTVHKSFTLNRGLSTRTNCQSDRHSGQVARHPAALG